MITLDHLDNPGHSPVFSSQLISNVNTIFNLNPPLPHDITYLQVFGIRSWTSLEEGDLFYPSYPECHINQMSCRPMDIDILKSKREKQ